MQVFVKDVTGESEYDSNLCSDFLLMSVQHLLCPFLNLLQSALFDLFSL